MREKFPRERVGHGAHPVVTIRGRHATPRGLVAPAPSSRRRAGTAAGALALVTAVALAFVLDLGRPDFWDPGESRYAETVREMVATGNWLHPTLGFERYYDKPPAFFWIVAAAFRTFGEHEWAARLPSVLAAVLTIAWVVGFAWPRVGARAALLAGFILATAIQFVVLGRSVRMDMLLTWVMSVTLLQAYALATAEDDARAPAAWPLYAFSAVGLLVKGPVAVVLPALIMIVFLVATRTPLPVRRLRPGPIGVLAIAGLALLYLVLAFRAPDYLWTFLFQHNVGRYVGRALAGHQEPFWYYFWILPVTFLPWTLFLPRALARAARRAGRHDHLTIFLLAWCVVPFVFFTLARAKLATYLLPIFPALALLVAVHLDVALRAAATTGTRVLRWPLAVWTVGVAVIAVGTPIGITIAFPGYGMQAWPSLLLLVFPVLGWWALRRGDSRLAPALVGAAALVTQVVFYRVGAPVVNDFASLRAAAEIATDLPVDAPVYAYKTRGHSFTYYGGRTLFRVRSPEAVAEVLGRDIPTAALVKRRHLEKIRGHLRAPVCIWWESPSGRALLANVPRPNHPAEARLVPASGADATDAPPGDAIPHC